jgi:glycine dehydrogenase
MSEFSISQTHISELNAAEATSVCEAAIPKQADVIEPRDLLRNSESFIHRHIGPTPEDIQQMLATLGVSALDALIEEAVPPQTRMQTPLRLGESWSEHELLTQMKAIASKNQIFRSFMGMGYHRCITPPVIQRNILENPGWYTQYTPYQAEIAQGRLEALLNFQTMVIDLTGLEIANASLLDEGTAAAEAMTMSYNLCKRKEAQAFFVSQTCHPQTIEVVCSRAQSLGIDAIVGDPIADFDSENQNFFGVLLPYPATDGTIYDYRSLIDQAHQAGALVTIAADLLSLTLLKPPGELGADLAVGSTQRLGVPLGYGGPHAAYFATKAAYKRQIVGRLVGASKDVHGSPALRLALQTREQHIRRDKATSNICTAQALLAIVASMYAVYHGPTGLKRIAERIHLLACILAEGLKRLGYQITSEPFFDTVQVKLRATSLDNLLARAKAKQINLRVFDESTVGVALDEATSGKDLLDLFEIFAGERHLDFTLEALAAQVKTDFDEPLRRTSSYLEHPVFNCYHSETEFLRYVHRLQSKDLSLTTAMIPLGSCTMKLNATSELLPLTWPEFSQLHPFAPPEQAQGYQILLQQLEEMLAEITGMSGVSLQPNAGSQGEYAGLLVIRRYHEQQNEGHRHICLIPESAHGTNPASATMAGMKVVVIACDERGNIDLADLKAKAEVHQDQLAALMVTYPSTHGVFEESIQEICDLVHICGGQVFMDGANLNALVGLCRPADLGADVCHLNLHKTFCIPHGGGGPGVGPIGVRSHMVSFLPKHSLVNVGGEQGIGAITSAPWGSASILPISWVYISLMGAAGLTEATKVAILNANYIARRLEPYYPILYRGQGGWVAHECILDLRQLRKTAGIEVNDLAKRLMDYGFHAPTISWPVAGTMMIEPTESESKQELDRFCEAMIAIRAEIREIERGEAPRQNNVLKNAPHTSQAVIASDWKRPYSREKAAYPTPWIREAKFWPAVGRIDNAFGDRHLICACLPLEAYMAE